MNQDFTVKKKQYLSEKKKFVQRGSPEKKIPAQAVSEKTKNSCELKIPPPPITFLMVRPLEIQAYSNTKPRSLLKRKFL